jgi:hypothetical protein
MFQCLSASITHSLSDPLSLFHFASTFDITTRPPVHTTQTLQRKYDAALLDLNRALEDDRDSALLHLYSAECWRHKGRPVEVWGEVEIGGGEMGWILRVSRV